jgi:hypothetical protein
MRLKIQLPTTWFQEENPDGPATFYREDSTSAFQVSWAENQSATIPTMSDSDLVQFALDFGAQNGFGKVLETRNGMGRFGLFGTAIFRSDEHPRIQLWVVTNNSDFIFATHICDTEPVSEEILEAQQIAESLTLGPE